jgi:outer membrane murein-binding lipoprotein Lpp
MVMKYALAEQKNIELTDKIRKMESTVSDLTTEKENLMTYLNAMRSDKQKLKEIHDKKVSQAP